MSTGALAAADFRVRDRMLVERPEHVASLRAEPPAELLELVERAGLERFALRRGVKIATVRAACDAARAKLAACRMVPRRGDRREDCDGEDECLDAFVRAHPNARACSCPAECGAYQPRGRGEFHHISACRPGCGSTF